MPNTAPPERLSAADLQVRPPLTQDWLPTAADSGQGRRADARLRLTYRDQSRTFLLAYHKQWTAAAFRSALERAQHAAKRHPEDLPMVVLPYLSDEMLGLLEAEGVSGLDLVGNGLILTDSWLLRWTGHPNPYRNPQVVKSPYQGKSALVARALFNRAVLKNARELQAHIEWCGGQVSQPVISRALQAFRDDLLVGSQGEYGIVVLQPEQLLDRLTEGWKATVDRWQRSGQTELWRGRVEGDPDDVIRHLYEQADATGSRCVVTGVSAALRHTALASGDAVSVYADRLGALLDGLPAEATRRFPNLYILRAPDEAVYFDARPTEGRRWPSLLQRYLELTLGDARLQGSAQVIRQEMLHLLEEYKTVKLSLGDPT